ncbi:hypothetical protein KJ966_12890 [bacterium]|nr:hypothetical protein [bacterium]
MKSDHNMPTPFIIGFDGTSVTPSLKSHLLEINPAGVVLFRRNIESVQQVMKLITDLKDLLGAIIIAVDHEGGVVSRFPEDCPVPPSPNALRYADSRNVTREACRLQAELLNYLGFNLNFAPVLDLAVDPENQVIGTRAYSADPTEVGEYGEICFNEHQKLNIATSAKHFPGHGRTDLDSHYVSGNVIHSNLEEFQNDIEPFGKLVDMGIPTVMTAHLTYPIVDPEFPASLSAVILKDILRTQLKFSGLIISDCVEMAGITGELSPENIITQGLLAGIDLFISSFSIKKSKEFQLALKRAYQDFLYNHREPGYFVFDRLKPFRERYITRENKQTSLPDYNDAILKHQKTLEKVNYSKLNKAYQKMVLVELANRSYQGVNADPGWNQASRIIKEECYLIEKSVINTQCNLQEFNNIMKLCNESRLTCVLMTYNGYRNETYEDFMKIFQKVDSGVHIALLDKRDLRNFCQNEWVTRGFNAFTGKMLAQELLRLV